jgi:hypothetical protein
MTMVFKFLFAAGFVFVLAALRAVTAYAAWRVALNDRTVRRAQLARAARLRARPIAAVASKLSGCRR